MDYQHKVLTSFWTLVQDTAERILFLMLLLYHQLHGDNGINHRHKGLTTFRTLVQDTAERILFPMLLLYHLLHGDNGINHWHKVLTSFFTAVNDAVEALHDLLKVHFVWPPRLAQDMLVFFHPGPQSCGLHTHDEQDHHTTNSGMHTSHLSTWLAVNLAKIAMCMLCVCLCVCVHVCVSLCVSLCVCACTCVCLCVSVYALACACMRDCAIMQSMHGMNDKQKYVSPAYLLSSGWSVFPRICTKAENKALLWEPSGKQNQFSSICAFSSKLATSTSTWNTSKQFDIHFGPWKPQFCYLQQWL